MAITYSVSTNTITVTGYTSAVPCTFLDIYNADKAGTLSLHARTGITGTDGSTVAVDRAERPADYIVLGKASNDLGITIANWIGTSATIRIIGTDRDGAAQTEDRLVAGNGTYYTTKWFKTITHTQVTTFTATSFDYDLAQGQWGTFYNLRAGSFSTDAQICIGDGSTATYFADDNISFTRNDGFATAFWQFFIRGKANSHIHITRSSLFCQENSNRLLLGGTWAEYAPDLKLEYVLLYGALVNGTSPHLLGISSSGLFKRVTILKGWTPYIFESFAFDRLSLYGAEMTYVKTSTISDIEVVDGITYSYTIYGDYVGDWYNCKSINPTTATIKAHSITADCSFIDADFDAWTFDWVSDTLGKKIWRKYSFDLKMVDKDSVAISSATVKIWDKNDSLVTNVTTNASGVIATQTINYGYYNNAGGNTPVMETPHEMRVYKYGKSMSSSKSSIEAKTDWALTMYTDDHITQTTEATVAAYTGITINHTAETITISENHTLDEIYDYCQYDIIAATKQLDQTMHTADGVNFVSEYSFVVNTGITVTATDQKLSMVSGETYTLTGTAQFTGIIATTTTTRIPIKLTNIVDGSRYWVGKESDGSTIFEGTQSGSGTVTGYYEHTANIDIDIRVRKSSASVKYKPWVGEGTLSAEAFSLRIRQIQDGIIT